MAWDSSRPVPWKRLLVEWAVIGAAVALMSLLFTDNRDASGYITVVLGGAVYVAFGAILAKFGYSRKTLKQLRAEAAAAPPRAEPDSTAPSRQRPAPTKRTSSGPSNRPVKRKR